MPIPVEEIIISEYGSGSCKQLILITSIFGDQSRFKKYSIIGKKVCINELIQTNNINNIFKSNNYEYNNIF